MEQKLNDLQKQMIALSPVGVAYSGGVDSTLLLKLAHDWLGNQAAGFTAVSPSMPAAEIEAAADIAQTIGAKLYVIKTQEVENPDYQNNNADRCYFCKQIVYEDIIQLAAAKGFTSLVDGTNLDDTGDIRPGRKAAREHGVISPFVELGFTKAEIRQLARELGLPNWNKPSAACLSSRIPYGTPVTIPILGQIESAERLLHQLGFEQVRVRHHKETARIEVPETEFPAILKAKEQILNAFRQLGYTYITLDLAGYRTGSMNEGIKTNHGSRNP